MAMATVFHVTHAQRLPSILREGLQPSIGPRSQDADEQQPAVYVFPSEASARRALASWLGDQFEPQATLVMLEIDLPATAVNWPKGPKEAVCRHPVAPQCILGHRPIDREGALTCGEPSASDPVEPS